MEYQPVYSHAYERSGLFGGPALSS